MTPIAENGFYFNFYNQILSYSPVTVFDKKKKKIKRTRSSKKKPFYVESLAFVSKICFSLDIQGRCKVMQLRSLALRSSRSREEPTSAVAG